MVSPPGDYRKYGVPTIRTDLTAPRIRHIHDRTNYGDESNAYGLINPSIYSAHGVYEKDFLIPRTKDAIRAVFANVGMEVDAAKFDRLYDAAADTHPMRQVSVESFRNVLDKCQAIELKDTCVV